MDNPSFSWLERALCLDDMSFDDLDLDWDLNVRAAKARAMLLPSSSCLRASIMDCNPNDRDQLRRAYLIDEARDNSIKEQMAVAIRYVNKKGNAISLFRCFASVFNEVHIRLLVLSLVPTLLLIPGSATVRG